MPILVVGPARIESLEGPEQPLDFSRGDERSGVGDGHEGVSTSCAGHNLDVAVDDVMADGIGEQVDDQSLDEQ